MRTVTRQEFQTAIEEGIAADLTRRSRSLTKPQIKALRLLGETAKTTGWRHSPSLSETQFSCPLHQTRIGLVSYDFFSSYDAAMDSVLGCMPNEVKIKNRLPLLERIARRKNA